MTRLPTGSDGRAFTSLNVVLLVTPLFCFSLVLITGKEQVSWWETWYPASHTQNWQDLISVLLVEGSISVMFGAVYVTDSSYCSVFFSCSCLCRYTGKALLFNAYSPVLGPRQVSAWHIWWFLFYAAHMPPPSLLTALIWHQSHPNPHRTILSKSNLLERTHFYHQNQE